MSQATYEQYLKQGDNLANQGKLNEAFEQYVQARNLDPSRQEARKQVINMAIKREDFAAALQEYLDWADFAHSRGKLDEALRILQDAMSLEGQYEKRGFLLDRRSTTAGKLRDQFGKFAPKFYERLGEIYFEKKDYQSAVDYLDKSVELQPNNTKAHSLMGMSFLAKGQLDKAKGPFQEVVRFQGPEAALAYEKLAEIYSNQGNMTQMVIWLKDAAEAYIKNEEYSLAVRALERILEAEPANKEILTRLGEIYAREGSVQDAVRIYKQLAEIYSQAGIFDKVIVLYEKLVEWEPDNVDIINRVVDIYRVSLNVDPGNIRARIKLIENLLKKGAVEEVVEEYLHLVDSYIKIGLLDEAESCCEEVLKIEPEQVKAREILADLYVKTGKAEKAGEHLVTLVKDLRVKGEDSRATELMQKAMELSPAKSELYLGMANDFLAKGEVDQALAEFEKVLAEVPDHPDALWQVGKILFERRQWEAAEQFLERLLKRDSGRLEARIKLVEIYEAQLLREMEELSHLAG